MRSTKLIHAFIGMSSAGLLAGLIIMVAACSGSISAPAPATTVPTPTVAATQPSPLTPLPIGEGPEVRVIPTPDHPHPPGTTPHIHAEPGSAGAELEKDLQERLAQETPAPPAVHEGSEGITLGSGEQGESVYQGARCDPTAPVREYRVVAINVEVTLNRFLDYDPEGRMYVLEEELERVRQEEAQNRDARADRAESAVSLGLQGDAIQPLTLRANQGECLRIVLRNALEGGEPASLHIHGSSAYVASTGAPAIATNSDSMAASGGEVAYQWMIGEDEGTYYFHSHGDGRLQTSHGLFGALIVEPRGSTYLNPIGGGELKSGWSAIIQDPQGSDFREYAVFYHEIGNERFRHRTKSGQLVPFVDPFTSSYKPGGRALNYRSEPFMDRLQLQYDKTGAFDRSQAYSSYTFGDPATPIARSYLGDPVKTRLVHGGSEVFHVHHTHGGAIRWRRQPGTEDSGFDRGLDKSPPLRPQASERVDAQSIGPSETYNLESECGSGGCQQSVGDFLTHCHVAHHYISGMWAIWRVYSTRQGGAVSQDGLPPLMELPDRLGQVEYAVTSRELAGRTVDWKGRTFQVTRDNLAEWVERQLPPPGVPKGYDASVLDWRKEGDLYLNEPDSDQVWPDFRSPAPGVRPPFYFDPRTGKLAYPFLRPHLGKRPPFAPNHGPAPFLSPIQQGRSPPQPGENGPWSLCPAGTKLREFVIHAITLPISLNRKANLVDPVGQLYVLKEEEDAIRAKDSLKVPLAIRANAGEDCVDIIFKSELEDTGENFFFSKVNIHIHFVQFDIQGSDGVNTGFNYETSVRPFRAEGEVVTSPASAGDTAVELRSAKRFQPGILVGVGMDQDKTFEIKRIAEVDGNRVVFDEPLQHPHDKGEFVSAEFVRYRWYPDVEFGTAYFHDHVDALTSWKHGLFGALISEPPGSTYHDPGTGAEVMSGTIVDVHTDSIVSPDVTGSFRELVMFIQDDNLITHIGDSSGSSFNMRVEPLEARGGDPSLRFSSEAHGDPETPILNAFLGDPIVVRTLVSGANDVHTWHVVGHWFRGERFSKSSMPISTIHIGISERYDLVIPRAGGPQEMAGDYLYYNGRTFKLREGSWGIIRVHDGNPPFAKGGVEGLLQKLPGREEVPKSASSVCPPDAPLKEFNVAAIEVPLPMLSGGMGRIYILEADKAAVISGSKAPEPLVLHVNVRDCIKVRLSNELPEGKVSFHADMLAYDPKESMGIVAGFNPQSPGTPSQTIAPGEKKTYTFFAHPDYGETTALVRDWGDVLSNPRLGLYGAIVVGPEGATYTHPVTREDISLKSSWRADVLPPDGPGYRDFALFLQDEDEVIGTHVMPYSEQVKGVVGLSYKSEPLAGRLKNNPDTSRVFVSDTHGDPSTPVMEAYAGDAVRIHVSVPFSEQSQVFSIEGHRWPLEPRMAGSDLLSSAQVGATETLNVILDRGAGGRARVPGDYLYGDHREPYREAGLWGLFRIYAPGAANARLMPLPVR